jgi:hypothetical protein
MRIGSAAAGALAGLALFAQPAWAALDEIWSTPIANWRIAAYRDHDSGRFNNCAVAVRFNSGIVLSFRLDAELRWQLGLVNQDWQFQPGEAQPVRYFIDANPPVDGTAAMVGSTEAVIDLPPIASFMSQLQRGQTLTVTLKDNPMRFNLAGASRMLGEASQCARRYAIAGRSAKAAVARPATQPASAAVKRQAHTWVDSLMAAGALADSRALTPAEMADWSQGGADDDTAAMWSSPSVLGRMSVSAVPKGTNLDDLASALAEADQRACGGRFSASKTADEAWLRRLDTVCEGDQGSLVADYILFADGDGNAYTVSHMAIAGGGKDGAASAAGQAFRANAFKPGLAGAPTLP